jgi:hypothetical protein
MVSYNLCWKPGCYLSLFMQTRAEEFVFFFFFTFSLSTELLEDKQRFKLGGVDTSPSYLLFLTLFLLFWTLICMIWTKLTRTDAVFSRTTMVSFLCRNKSSRNGTKLCEEFLYNKRKILEPRTTGGGTWVGTTHQGAPPPPGVPRWVVRTWWPRRPWNRHYKITFFQKKSGRKNCRVLRDGAAVTVCTTRRSNWW